MLKEIHFAPGIGCSRLWLHENETWSRIWLSISEFTFSTEQLIDNLAMTPVISDDGTLNWVESIPERKVFVEDFGGYLGTNSMEYLFEHHLPQGELICSCTGESTTYPAAKSASPVPMAGTQVLYQWIEEMKAKETAIHTLPYDWRLPPWQINWKHFIESLEQSSEKVVLIGHSMGGLYLNYFLNTAVTKEWKEKHIALFVPIAAPFLGSGRAGMEMLYPTKLLLSPLDLFESLVEHEFAVKETIESKLISMLHYFGSPLVLLPDLLEESDIQLLDDQAGALDRTRNMLNNQHRDDPGVPVLCVWGEETKDRTIQLIKQGDMFDQIIGPGDSEVESSSASHCINWDSTVRGLRVLNADHESFVRSPGIVDQVYSAIQDILSTTEDNNNDLDIVRSLAAADLRPVYLGAKSKHLKGSSSKEEFIDNIDTLFYRGAWPVIACIGFSMFIITAVKWVATVWCRCGSALASVVHGMRVGLITALGGVVEEDEPSNSKPYYDADHSNTVHGSSERFDSRPTVREPCFRDSPFVERKRIQTSSDRPSQDVRSAGGVSMQNFSPNLQWRTLHRAEQFPMMHSVLNEHPYKHGSPGSDSYDHHYHMGPQDIQPRHYSRSPLYYKDLNNDMKYNDISEKSDSRGGYSYRRSPNAKTVFGEDTVRSNTSVLPPLLVERDPIVDSGRVV